MAEMTRNSVNFYAILNETLFLPYEFNGVFLQLDEKIIFQNSEKISPVFRNIRDSFFRLLYLY